MAKAFTEFTQEVVRYVPGATRADVAEEAARTAEEFFRRGQCWWADFTMVWGEDNAGRAPVGSFVFDDSTLGASSGPSVSSEVRVERLRWIVFTDPASRLSGTIVSAPNMADFIAIEGEEGSDPVAYRWSESESAIEFDRPVPSGRKMWGSAVVRPAPNPANGLPDLVFDRWRRDIVDGTVARMCDLPGKPWTDERLAVRMRRRFERAMSDARANAQGMRDDRVALYNGRFSFDGKVQFG